MSFGKSKQFKKLPTSERILARVSEVDIFQLYLGSIPTRPISSPFREDVNPSFSLFVAKDHGKIFYKDFATGEAGDCFMFVMRLFNFRTKIETFNKIAADFNLDDLEYDGQSIATSPIKLQKLNETGVVKKISSNRVRISVTVRDWNLDDKKYWNGKYGFTKAQLEYCNVYPISHYFINGSCTKAIGLTYAFVEEKDGVQTFKIYQPYADKQDKWFNNNDYSTWELWTQLPESGDVVIIASSRKDAMVIKSLFPSNRITACSLQSESVNPKESVVEELKNRFKYVFILYDNDQFKVPNAGKVAGEKIAKKFDIMDILIPDIFQLKDPSDFREKQGRENTKKMLISIIKKRIKKYNI